MYLSLLQSTTFSEMGSYKFSFDLEQFMTFALEDHYMYHIFHHLNFDSSHHMRRLTITHEIMMTNFILIWCSYVQHILHHYHHLYYFLYHYLSFI